jgi:hypothetical protein
MPPNLTPEQVEAFRQQMRERFGKRGAEPTTSTKTPKAPVDATSAKPPKTPKVR